MQKKQYLFANNFLYNELKELYHTTELRLEKEYIQHKNMTTLSHSIHVAYVSIRIVQMFHLKVDEKSLCRGALLHDYFLYDWHVPGGHKGLHGFHHPYTALSNAKEHTELNKIEENIIVRHMFPLTIIPPKYKEAWIVSVADKICAVHEMVLA